MPHGPTAAILLRHAPILAGLVALLAPAAAWSAGASTLRDQPAPIRNFGQVNEHYYRGGQPRREQFAQLGSLGIRTVIDLQVGGQADEPAWVRAAGMRYFRIPLTSFRPASEAQTERFLALVNDSTNWPVYVHCAGGRHRTGEMTAIYRITHDGWSSDRAFAEMQKFGWYSFPFHGSLKGYVYRYYDAHRPVAAGRAFADPARTAAADTAATGAAAVASPAP